MHVLWLFAVLGFPAQAFCLATVMCVGTKGILKGLDMMDL